MQDVPDLSSVLSDSRWVRALARRLVADAGSADDLAQDTWVSALESGAAAGGLRRAWVSLVLRRKLFERRRAEAARSHREQRVARREGLPSTLDMVERAAIQRDLVQAVLDLDEPYRSTVLWRFFEELPPRAIADRAGVPVATVHTRLSRAMAQLRVRLDKRYGDGRQGAGLAAVGLLLTSDRLKLGAWMMKTSTKVAISALVLVSTVAVWSVLRRDVGIESVTTAVEPIGSNGADQAKGTRPDILVDESTQPRRDVLLPAEVGEKPAGMPAAAGALAAHVLRGRVLDERGRALSGVRLSTRPVVGTAFESGLDGRFEAQIEREVSSIVSADPRYATVLPGAAPTRAEAIVVVAPRIELSGTVVDEVGARLQGVQLSVALPPGFGADFGQPLDTALSAHWSAVSGSDGTFAFAEVPAVTAATLHASLGAFQAHSDPLPLATAHDLWIVLHRAPDTTANVRGTVVDPAGARVSGARVGLGSQTVFTDASGRFEIGAAQNPRPTRLVAVARGFQPAILDSGDGTWTEDVVLRLGPAPLSLSGSVVDGEGRPVEKARVWLSDPTLFGVVENEPLHVEALATGDDQRFWAFALTDAHGRFRLDGLLDRDYGLVGLDMATLLQTETRTAAGRDDVVLRLPKDETWPVVKGRVVTAQGEGILSVSVQAQRPAFTVEFPSGGTRDEFSHRPAVTTGADGSFEMSNVPKSGIELFAFGDTILFAYVHVDASTDPLEVRIVARLRMHLQVELDLPVDRADGLRVLDGEGKPVLLRVMRGATSYTDRKAKIVDGRSQVLSLSDEARTVVLTRGGVEVGRVGVSLVSGKVEIVRW